jgi:hypothetical protein
MWNRANVDAADTIHRYSVLFALCLTLIGKDDFSRQVVFFAVRKAHKFARSFGLFSRFKHLGPQLNVPFDHRPLLRN